MNNIIEIKNYNLSYGDVELFSDFNFTVARGSFVGIYGPTGKGKTTLLNKIVNDYIKNYKIAYVFQDNKLLEMFSVKKNIMIPLKNILSKDLCEKEVSHILSEVNLQGKENEKVSVLSGGEHQRVNIARALSYVRSAHCDILIMDEPFSAQDDENRNILINLTKSVSRETGVTGVIVSHNKSDLENLCDEIIDL